MKVVEQANSIQNANGYQLEEEFKEQSPTDYSSSFTNNHIFESHRIEKGYLADESEVHI